jgi:hypothetical protein
MRLAIRCFIGTLLLAGASLDAAGGSTEPVQYADKWLVIAGAYRSFDAAVQAKTTTGHNASIVLSTYYENLVPGWYILVMGDYSTRVEAQDVSQKLKHTKNIDNYVKYSGSLFFSEDEGYRLLEISDEDYSEIQPDMFYHCGSESPDQRKTVSFESHEEDPEEFPCVLTASDAQTFNNIYVFARTEDIAWSLKSDKFAFVDYDGLYNSGDQRLYIIDINTLKHIDFSLHELIAAKDFSGRRKLSVYDLAWSGSGDAVIFCMEVDFLGSSGDDMIDQHRIADLGQDFDRSSPVHVGYYMVYLKP